MSESASKLHPAFLLMSFWEHYFTAVLFTGLVAVPVYFWTIEVPRRNREDQQYWREHGERFEQWRKKHEEEKVSSYPFAK